MHDTADSRRYVERWVDDLMSSRMPERAKVTGYALSRYADWHTGDNAFPGLDNLVERSGQSRSTVIRALKDLREAGWIERQPEESRRMSRHGGRLADEYSLTWPLPQADADAQCQPDTMACEPECQPDTIESVSLTPGLVSDQPNHGVNVDTPPPHYLLSDPPQETLYDGSLRSPSSQQSLDDDETLDPSRPLRLVRAKASGPYLLEPAQRPTALERALAQRDPDRLDRLRSQMP